MENPSAVYIVAYHSECNRALRGSSGQFSIVEQAIARGEWPYDNGDDPSFHVARRGGPLTWGVCRQDVRNAILPGDIVVFFASTSISTRKVLYRLSAVATVAERMHHLRANRDPRFRPYPYINLMGRAVNGAWRYDETDRPLHHRHADWLWRMADAGGMTKADFAVAHSQVYQTGQFSRHALRTGEIRLACNYIVFSAADDETFISPAPVAVATALKGQRERWCNSQFRRRTVGQAARHGARDYLRAASPTGYFHRHIRFEMVADEARQWRSELIAQLAAESAHTSATALGYRRERGAGCGS